MNISSAYHPQIDGQTERTHRTIEQILRAFVHKKHSDWYDYLPLAEFSYNNSKHASTSFTPFEALYGISPITPPTLLNPQLFTPTNIIEHIHDIHSFITEQLKISKTLQSHYVNKKRIDEQFTVSDKVMIDTSDISIRNHQPNKKFKQKFLGPYPIVKVISPVSYELQLPGPIYSNLSCFSCLKTKRNSKS